MSDVIACLNFWKWIKPSFATPAALKLYDFFISCMLCQLLRARTIIVHTFIHMCVDARAQMSTWKIVIIRANISCAHKTRSRTSQSFTYASWSTEASELPRSWEKRRRGRRTRSRERAEASTPPFITNLFHPVVQMGYCSLRASKATSMSSTSRYEREIPLSSGRVICTSSSVSIRAQSLTFLSKCQI